MADHEESSLSLREILGTCYGTPADRSNNRKFTRWSIIWAASILTASWLVATFELPTPLAWAIVLAPNIAAVATLSAYLKYLRMADELQRRIHLEGLAIGFGVGWLFMIGYLVALGAGAPPLNLAVLILIMTAGWIAGNVFAVKKYL